MPIVISTYKSLLRLWNYLTIKHKLQFVKLCLLMIFVSFCEIISIGAILPFLAVFTNPEKVFYHQYAKLFLQIFNIKRPLDLLLPLTICFSFISITVALLRLYLLYFQNKFSYNLGGRLALDVYKSALYQPYSVHVSRNSSEIISTISIKVDNVVGNSIMPSLNLLNSIMMTISILATLIFIKPMFALISFGVFSIIYLLISYFIKNYLTKFGNIINLKSNEIIKSLQEGLGGIRDIIIGGTQKVYLSIFEKTIFPLRNAQANVQIISSGPKYIIEGVGMVLISTLAYFIYGRGQNTLNSIPVIGAFALGAQRLLPVLQQLYLSISALRSGQAGLIDVLNLLDQNNNKNNFETTNEIMNFNDKISLSNLKFRYNIDSPLVINNLDLIIKKGNRIGIIGTTGSGKSTLLDIIMGLQETYSGNFTIDGIELSEKNRITWRKNIAHVPQTIYLSDSTIEENIAFGIPTEEIDHELVKIAAKQAKISDSIDTWGKNYKTLVGERGVRLSGGQKQRIGIARALYKKANLIVFDEATSSLDNETEQSVMESIENLSTDLTLLICAHRYSTLKKCDLIIKIENGSIVKTGLYSDFFNEKNN